MNRPIRPLSEYEVFLEDEQNGLRDTLEGIVRILTMGHTNREREAYNRAKNALKEDTDEHSN